MFRSYATVGDLVRNWFNDMIAPSVGSYTTNLSASAGNDTIIGDSSANAINAGLGDDWVDGGAGADIMDGGDGIDTLSYLSSTNTDGVFVRLDKGIFARGDAQGDSAVNFEDLVGTHYDDHLVGDSGDNMIWGASGDDSIFGGGGNDFLIGDTGRLSEGTGNVVRAPDAGNSGFGLAMDVTDDFTFTTDANVEHSDVAPHVTVSATGDAATHQHFYTVKVGEGQIINLDIDNAVGIDTIIELYDADRNLVATNNDGGVLDAGSTSTTDSFLTHMATSSGAYFIVVKNVLPMPVPTGSTYDLNISIEGADLGSEDILYGGNGDDVLLGGTNKDFLYGGDGEDYLLGGRGNDVLDGGAGADIIQGGKGFDTVVYEGNDNLTVNLGAEFGLGGDADGDIIRHIEKAVTQGGNDLLVGANMTDNVLDAGAGDDILRGLSGDDKLIGREGRDILDGGLGDDFMNGGSGDDLFIISLGDGHDTIKGFTNDVDVVDLRGTSYTEFADIQLNMSDDGSDTTLTIDANTSIVFVGRLVSDFSDDDFLLDSTAINNEPLSEAMEDLLSDFEDFAADAPTEVAQNANMSSFDMLDMAEFADFADSFDMG